MSEIIKNKAVVDRLAENIQTKAVYALQQMLQECIVKSRRDLLFEAKEYEEEICIVLPEFGKDLKVEPIDYDVRRGFSFAFRLSGTYAQLQPCEYVYEYIGSPDAKRKGRLREQLENIGIVHDYEKFIAKERSDDWHETYDEYFDAYIPSEIYVPVYVDGNSIGLARPYRHKDLKFCYARLGSESVDVHEGDQCWSEKRKPVKELGRGHFEMPVNVSFRLEKGEFRFDKMYFTDPNGDPLTDIYNNEICMMPLKEVFVIKKSGDPGKSTISFKNPEVKMFDPYGGETLGLAKGVVEEDELKGDAGDIDMDGMDTDVEDMDIDSGDINITHSQLVKSLFENLEKERFHLESREILSDFAVYQYEVNRRGKRDPHYRDWSRAHYNLLIRANETDRALDFVDVLRNNIFPPVEDDKYVKCMEMDPVDREELIRDFADADLIVIYNCKERTVLRTDEAGSAQDRVKAEIDRYEAWWGFIAACAAKEGAARLIVIADDAAYRSILRYNRALLKVVSDAHLRLREMTPEDVYELFMETLERSTFGKTMSEEAKTKVEKYIRDIYPTSDLRGREFIKEHFDKISLKYLLKEGGDDSLADCIPSYQMPSVDKILNELRQKVGLEDVVKKLEVIYAMKDVLVKEGEPYHMFFEGNPGTGKTMVARMMAEMLYHMGVVKRPILKEAGAGDFRSPRKGETDLQVKGLIREAYGGVLFIDEAYTLADEEFQEGFSILLTEMADWTNPERPVVIFAGYEEKMHDLLKANKGLESRIKDRVKFRDYNRDELKAILTGRLGELEFKVEDSEEAEDLLEELIRKKMSSEFFGNARDMENLAYELAGKWGETKAENKTEEKIIRAEHLKKLLPETNTERIKRILEDQPDLKKELERFKTGVAYKKALKKDMDHADIPAVNRHMLFMGNPGTGKTTVAGMLADYLCEMRVLPTNKCIPVEAKDLLTHDKKMTPAEHTEEYIRRAKGGILFIDEAYLLMKRSGEEVIQVLITAMEKYKENTIFVFAGYPREMNDFLEMNPGLESRIGYTFRFRSYETDTLVKMFINKMKDIGLYFEEEDAAKKKLEDIMRYFRGMREFGNGRFVENLLNVAMGRHGARLAERYPGDEKNPPLQDCPPEQLRTYTADDLPSKEEILKSFYGIDSKMDEYEEKETTIIHELGHATVKMAANPDRIRNGIRVVEKITVKAVYGAEGYVRYHLPSLRTEKDYKVHLASMLGGRNAEKVYFQDHTAECRQDYKIAKRLAKQMIKEFAMGELGITSPKDLLREADILATKLIKENKEFIDIMKRVLMKYEEMEGEDIEGAYRAYIDFERKELYNYLKDIHYPIDDPDDREKQS